MSILPKLSSRSKVRYPIRPVKQGDLNIPPPPGKSWGQRLKAVLMVYSTIATLLFTAWLIVPAIADPQEPSIDMPWTVIKPLAEACMRYGGFEYANELYSCHHAGTLDGTLKMPPTLTIPERQKRMAVILPPNVWGYWISP